ncbi:molybdate ABC transporter permease subunit [Cochlodiniinecator piscidefendens]|uniref:molybdate ABC transporter permease subunit n=1 Tax=Cochlodiniinecator piscidefendens TaxID=2715756 RepID=UPI00140D25DC|nr:molybdate ABC transporter permease subunit [Cochlodiniinecator piscidefendens]
MTSVWPAVWLSISLALITSTTLLIIATPLAWWLSRSASKMRPLIEAITALPLVLPPTVLGFYLLVLFSPQNPIGQAWLRVTGETLAFSFSGLVFASLIYSLPFAVQPLRSAFQDVGRAPLEAASTLGANPVQQFFYVAFPLARKGYLSAFVLSFAHTLGEFGVVLMVGGNIPGQTRVISIEIFNRVETLDYSNAHWLSGGLLLTSVLVLVIVFSLQKRVLP